MKLDVISLEVNLDKVSNIKAKLMQEEMFRIQKEIETLKSKNKSIYIQLIKLIGAQLEMQHKNPYIGQVIVEPTYGLIYIYNDDLKLEYCWHEEDSL